jgi:hypothetical protein
MKRKHITRAMRRDGHRTRQQAEAALADAFKTVRQLQLDAVATNTEMFVPLTHLLQALAPYARRQA